MSRETKYTVIILKKQPFNEADEIITCFSRENGKIRCLAKSVKFSKSKLQQKLQTLFLVTLTLSAGKLPKIIRVEVEKVFAHIRESLAASKRAFYALELILKFTPDEQKNERLYNLFADFLEFLDQGRKEELLDLGVAKLKVEILQAVGLAVSYPAGKNLGEKIFFSQSHGGFSANSQTGSLPIPNKVLDLFLEVKDRDFSSLGSVKNSSFLKDLQGLLSGFIEYQLERKIKSENFMV